MTVGPFYIEIFGEAGMGKTHQAHQGSPDPIHLDTANTSMDVGDYDIDPNPDRKGESWDVIHSKVHDWDTEEAERRYRYVSSYQDAQETISGLDGFQTVILDNWYDFRTLIVDHMADEYPDLMQSRGWPTQNGWGKAADLYRQFSDMVLETGRHFVIISEMSDEYEDGDKTGGRERDGPSKAQFNCDFRIKLDTEEKDGEMRRQAIVKKNRWLDRFSNQWVESIGSEYDFETLMAVSQIPEEEWR